MQYLTSFSEFRTWLIEVAFMTSEAELARSDSAISYEEHVLPELNRLSPESYPCVVYMESEPDSTGMNEIRFILKNQIEQWATAMKETV